MYLILRQVIVLHSLLGHVYLIVAQPIGVSHLVIIEALIELVQVIPRGAEDFLIVQLKLADFKLPALRCVMLDNLARFCFVQILRAQPFKVTHASILVSAKQHIVLV